MAKSIEIFRIIMLFLILFGLAAWNVIGVVLSTQYHKQLEPSDTQNTILIYYGFIFSIIIAIMWIAFVVNTVINLDEDEGIDWFAMIGYGIISISISLILPVIGWKIHTQNSLKIRKRWQKAAQILYGIGAVLITTCIVLVALYLIFKDEEE